MYICIYICIVYRYIQYYIIWCIDIERICIFMYACMHAYTYTHAVVYTLSAAPVLNIQTLLVKISRSNTAEAFLEIRPVLD